MEQERGLVSFNEELKVGEPLDDSIPLEAYVSFNEELKDLKRPSETWKRIVSFNEELKDTLAFSLTPFGLPVSFNEELKVLMNKFLRKKNGWVSFNEELKGLLLLRL